MKMVCIKKGQWLFGDGTPSYFRCPNYGEIVTVVGRRENAKMGLVFLLDGYAEVTKKGVRTAYSARNFRPIVHDEPKASTEKFDFRQKLKQDA